MGDSVATEAALRDGVEELYRTDGKRLWRALVGFARDPGVADDAVAEAFAQLLRRGSAVRDGRAWLWRAAFRIAAGELARRRDVQLTTHDRAVEDPEPAWGVVEALATLSPQQRAVVILRDYAGHSGRDTARILSTTETSVRVQLTRARRALRRELRA